MNIVAARLSGCEAGFCDCGTLSVKPDGTLVPEEMARNAIDYPTDILLVKLEGSNTFEPYTDVLAREQA